MTPLLAVEDLSVGFRQGGVEAVAVDRVSFGIGAGETVALVGESGSGKSVSALSVLRLLNYPAAHHPGGRILFGGRDLLALPEPEMRRVRGRDVTMVFQEPMTSLNPLHTVERQVGEILSVHRGIGGRAAQARVLELLDLVGLRDARSRLGAYPHQLSRTSRSCSWPTSRRPRSTSPCRRRSSRSSPTSRRGSAWRCCSSPTTSASCAASPTGSA